MKHAGVVALVALVAAVAVVPPACGDWVEGEKYALCVGVDEYDQQAYASTGFTPSSLNGTVNDAMSFLTNLLDRGGWNPDNATLLADATATKAEIRAAIANVASCAQAGDTFVYMQSSLGINFGAPTYSTDVALAAYDEAYYDYELAEDLCAFPAGVKVVVVLDASHSGGMFKSETSPRSTRAAAAPVPAPASFASRVGELMKKRRAALAKTRAAAAPETLSPEEIGWVTAADYDETSLNGGFYDTDGWMDDGEVEGDLRGGTFLSAFTWGWWSGRADSEGEGDGDGMMDAYEGWSFAFPVCEAAGFTPQCENVGVLRSVELGWVGDSAPPRKFALCVGIDEYMRSAIPTLSGCVNDAVFMSASLVGRGGWSPSDVVVLTNALATKDSIRSAILNVAAQAQPGDTFVYHQSSHGGQLNATDDILVGEDGKAVYLAVYDTRDQSSAYADWELAADLGEFAAGVKVVVIVDACHSGGLFKEAESSGAKGTRGADAESTPFDLAGRVSAMIDAGRAKRKTRGGDEPERISSSEIGWAVAAEYYESSMDGGFYHTDEWMGDPTYGNEYYDWTMRKFDYPASYKSGGAFLAAAIWGWWSGSADIDYEVGDYDGFCDVYELWKKGYDFCSGIGSFWYGYDAFHPQCTNITVLQSVELGWTVPADVLPAISPGADRDAIAVVFAGAADAQLRENISDVASYSAYRAWSETVKAPGGGPAVGAGAVWDYPLTWLSFALGADELVSSEPVDGDVSVESFSPSEDLEGGFSFEVGVKGVDIGSGGVAPSVLLANLAKAFSVEGSASLDDPQAFSSDGIVLTFDEPENGKARFTAQPSAPTDGPFFMRVKLR